MYIIRNKRSKKFGSYSQAGIEVDNTDLNLYQ